MWHIADLLMHSDIEKCSACQDNPNRKIAFSYVSLDVLSFFSSLASLFCSELFQQCFRASIKRINNKENWVLIIIMYRMHRYHLEIALLHRYESKWRVLLPVLAGDSVFLITEDTNSIAKMSVQSHICPIDVNLG